MNYRIENMEFRDPYRAILGILNQLISHPQQFALLRVADEDSANRIREIINDAVDRIKIEFDSKEKGPNPLFVVSKLNEDSGRVELVGPYGQALHPTGFEAKK